MPPQKASRAWRASGSDGVEEAQALTQRSLSLLRPTIRVKGSQLWANWNPRRKSGAIDDFLRAKKPDNAVVVQANWRDNPWFPDVLDEERRLITRGLPRALCPYLGGRLRQGFGEHMLADDMALRPGGAARSGAEGCHRTGRRLGAPWCAVWTKAGISNWQTACCTLRRPRSGWRHRPIAAP
jgi:hypothetical protein